MRTTAEEWRAMAEKTKKYIEEQQRNDLRLRGKEMTTDLLVKAIFAGHPGMIKRDVKYHIAYPDIVYELKKDVATRGQKQVFKEIHDEYDSYFLD